MLCVQNGLYSENVAKSVLGDRCVVLRAITHFGAIYRTGAAIGFTPREVDRWSLAEFFACVDGFKQANGIEDGPGPMTPARFDELRLKFKDK